MKTFMMKVDFISDLGVTGNNHLLQVRAPQFKVHQGKEDRVFESPVCSLFLSFLHFFPRATFFSKF